MSLWFLGMLALLLLFLKGGTVTRAAEVVDSGTCDGGNVSWVLDSEGTLTFSGTGIVSSVGHKADIKEVIVNEGITAINEEAFIACSSLKSVTLPDSLTRFGLYVFCNCTNLTSITLPSGVKNICTGTFYGCSSLTSITIPNGVTTIESHAFYGCSSLTHTDLPVGVKYLDPSAFDDCDQNEIFYAGINAPNLSAVSYSDNGIMLNWSQVTGAEGYKIYRSTDDQPFSCIADVSNGAATSWTDTGATTEGVKYQYKILAYKTVDGTTYRSTYSNVATGYYVTAPTITSIYNSASGVTMKWSQNTGASGYYIYRSVNGAAYTYVKTITSNATLSWTDTGAKTNGTKYQYKILAFKTVGETKYRSAYSGIKTIYFVSAPAISSVTNSAASAMTVKWGQNTTAAGYQIQYSTSSSFTSASSVYVTGSANVSKVIASLTKGKTYYVRVRSYKSVSGTNYYSAWGTAKSVQITK